MRVFAAIVALVLAQTAPVFGQESSHDAMSLEDEVRRDALDDRTKEACARLYWTPEESDKTVLNPICRDVFLKFGLPSSPHDIPE